jgi:UDP-glucuronate 4-epimerase
MDFIEAIEETLGKKAQKNMLPMQPGDVPSTYADITALEKELGYKPKVDVKEGIEKFIKWYREFYGV